MLPEDLEIELGRVGGAEQLCKRGGASGGLKAEVRTEEVVCLPVVVGGEEMRVFLRRCWIGSVNAGVWAGRRVGYLEVVFHEVGVCW